MGRRGGDVGLAVGPSAPANTHLMSDRFGPLAVRAKPSSSPLLVDRARAAVLREASRGWPSWDLTARQLSDLELLLGGFYTPLGGFMGPAAPETVKRDPR